MKYSADPVNLILTILEYTAGSYTPKQIVEMFNIIKQIEQDNGAAQITVLKDKKVNRDGTS